MTPGGEEALRFLRFLVVGGALFAIDLGLFLALHDALALTVPVAQASSVTVRTIIGFVAHKWFTFRGDTADDPATTARQGVAYLVQGVLNAPISVAIVWGCVWLLDGWALGGKVLAEGVMVVEVYLLYRLVVYSNHWFGGPGGEDVCDSNTLCSSIRRSSRSESVE